MHTCIKMKLLKPILCHQAMYMQFVPPTSVVPRLTVAPPPHIVPQPSETIASSGVSVAKRDNYTMEECREKIV
ncbi:hypothetical protein A2U01_0042449 [Trifolium medium]|uniref:Uncharacterized protein n=1 Tax=Trifolium medium TaxID=97028 RepID=A0A392QA75_9FABA|nr:hypothetical protein [Trifolium medium]